ncbi:MAG: peptide MFS transporter [Simkania sp.]|nr:peptide MFS transporter [Simkania sp.]
MAKTSSLPTRHPPEMILLAFVEMCQRFAFWGIGNLLVLYLVQNHGMADAKADNIFGIFTGVAFVLPIFGGYLADRWNYRQPVIIGCLFTAIGCFLIASNILSLVYCALVLVAIGGCIFTPSIYSLLGSVYQDRHNLREAGFSIYYASVNIGTFAAMVILGAFGNAEHWSIAFTIAGVVQIFGLWPLYKAFKMPNLKKVPNTHKFTLSFNVNNQALTKREKNRITVICVLSLISILFWLSYNQGGSSMTLYALKYTDRHIGSFEIPPSWLLSFESLYLVILAAPLASLYIFLSRRKLDPSPPMKTAFSLIAMGLCFAIMMFASRLIPDGAKTAATSPFYLISAYFLMAVAEMLLAPIGLALVTHLSPPKFTACLVGLWYVCIGIAFYSGGVVAGLMSSIKNLDLFFLIFVVLTIVPGIVLMFFNKKLNQLRHLESL